MRGRILLSVAVASAAIAACTVAPATETGGVPRFELSPSAEAQCQGSATDDAGGTGQAFSDLYRDYFGPTGKANCAKNAGGCHGAPSDQGALGSGGYVCPSTAASDCWQGMKNAGLLDDPDPVNNRLIAVLRRCDGSRAMPLEPASVKFFLSDLQRIRLWLADGAPND